MNKTGKGEFEFILGGVVFLVIMILFLSQGVFSSIISVFNIPEFGGFGILLGFLFILIVIVGFFEKLFEK